MHHICGLQFKYVVKVDSRMSHSTFIYKIIFSNMILLPYMNWEKIYAKYAGLWIAMKDDEETVIDSARTARSVLRKARDKGFENPLLNYIPKKVTPFIG